MTVSFHNLFPIIGLVLFLFAASLHAENRGPRVNAVLVDQLVGPKGWDYTRFNGKDAKFCYQHVPTIQETSPGKFVAVWYTSIRCTEDELWIATSHNHGDGWSEPSIIVPLRSGFNPGLLQPMRDPKASLYLYSRKGITADGFVYESPDDGVHWRVPPDGKLFKNIADPDAPTTGLFLPYWKKGVCTRRFLGLIKNPGLELPDGTVYLGSSVECGSWKAHIEVVPYGNYTGANTTAGEWTSIRLGSFIQPSFLVLSGDYRQLRVTGRPGRIRNALVTATSSDGGKTWSGTSTLKGAGEQGHCSVTLDNGYHLVLAEEPSRAWIIVTVSKDGAVLEPVIELEYDQPGAAYPVVIQASDRKVHIVYSMWQKGNTGAHIRHVVLDPDLVVGKTPDGGPTISAQPQSTNVALNGKAEFSVTASGSGELYYQWQRNTGKGLWYNLGRSAVLQTETAKAEMNSWQYRVVVTDDAGSTVSDAATLSVDNIPIARPNRSYFPKGISIVKTNGGVRIDYATSPGMDLYDLFGRKISTPETQNSSITLRKPMGLYFLHVDGKVRPLLITP